MTGLCVRSVLSRVSAQPFLAETAEAPVCPLHDRTLRTPSPAPPSCSGILLRFPSAPYSLLEIVIERIQIRHHKHCIEDRQASLSPGKVGTLQPAPVEENTPECEQAKAIATADPGKIQNPERQPAVLLKQGVLDQII